MDNNNIQEGKPKGSPLSVEELLICGNCNYGFGDCECGEWLPVYLNECKYLKHKKTGKIYEVAEHCGEYFITNSKVPVLAHYPKRLIKYYKNHIPSSESDYLSYLKTKNDGK